MKTSLEEKKLWAKYAKDCDALWILHKRIATSTPTKEYLTDKEELRSQLDIDIDCLSK